MIHCTGCGHVYCACEGIKCAKCGTRPARNSNSPTSLTKLPFIAMHQGQPVTLVPVDDDDQ